VSEGDLNPPPPYGDQPLKLRGSTDTSVALADVVVVVEATLRGGARITADYGLEYGRPVLVVAGHNAIRPPKGATRC
jgi:DNA recombination-mediator protein A